MRTAWLMARLAIGVGVWFAVQVWVSTIGGPSGPSVQILQAVINIAATPGVVFVWRRLLDRQSWSSLHLTGSRDVLWLVPGFVLGGLAMTVVLGLSVADGQLRLGEFGLQPGVGLW